MRNISLSTRYKVDACAVRNAFLLSILLLLPAPVLAQDQAPPEQGQNKPVFLQGSAMVHAEAMAPVAPQLQAGVEFD